MREVILSSSRSLLQLSMFLFGRIQSSSGYVYNFCLTYLYLYIYLLLSNTGRGFLERWLMPHVCQCLRGIWTVPLIICFDFWSAMKWSGSSTR